MRAPAPTRRPAQPEVFAGTLPPLRPTWPIVVLVEVLVAIIAGAITVLAGGPVWVVAVLGLVAIVGTVVLGLRSVQRQQVVDRYIESVAPALAVRVLTRSVVVAKGWTRGWPGAPRKLVIRYSSALEDDSRELQWTIVEQARRRFGVSYGRRQRGRDRLARRSIAVLEQVADADLRTEEVEQRAVDYMHTLFGADANVQVEMGETDPKAFIVKHRRGAQLAASGYRDRLERVVSTLFPGRWRAHWNLIRDSVRFELRPKMPSKVTLPTTDSTIDDPRLRYLEMKVPIGVDEDGEPLCWIPKRNPHFLITGGTGKGKTVLEHSVLAYWTSQGFEAWVIDGKRIEFIGWRTWPNVSIVAAKVEHQVRLVHAAHEEMERRYALIESGEATISDFEPLLIVTDEFATFKGRVMQWYPTVKAKGAPTKPPLFDLYHDIERLGRSAGIHLVTGLQRPDVEFLSGEGRDNYSQRFSLGRLSPQGAQMMWESYTTGVTLPANTRGYGITLNAEGTPVEALAYFTPDPKDATDPDDVRLLEQLRPTEVRYPRRAVADPSPAIDYEGSEDEYAYVYADYASARLIPFEASPTAHVEDEQLEVERRLPAPDVADEGIDIAADEADPYAGYADEAAVGVDDLIEGHLICVDESLDQWGVVTGEPAPDVVDDDCIGLDYRDFDTGEPEYLAVPNGSTIRTRIPKETA